jgi:cobaltochelatase CobS
MDLPNFDESKIEAKLRERRMQKSGVKTKITQQTTEEKENNDSPIEHFLTSVVRAHIDMRNNLWLVGPAGSGKSKCAELCAQALNLSFYCPPVGRETTNAQLFGYFNAQGNYVRTPIREAVESGGVVHLEEIDFASPAVGTACNALLANDVVGFPDQTIPKHKNLVIIASANTYGTGANASYIGSQGLNAATLDRFVFLNFPYDEKMERRLAPNKQWCIHVQQIRRKVQQLGLKHVVSPRATIMGGKMCNSKQFTWEEIEQQVLFKGLDPITIEKIKSTITL